MAISPQYQFATSAVLTEILQDKMPVLTFDDPLFTDIMPTRSVNAALVIWEQRDNYKGLLTARIADEGYGKVKREGLSTFTVTPGLYGDQKEMHGSWLTNARQAGQFGQAIDLNVAQQEDMEHLLTRAISRIRKIGWDLVTNGIYQVPGPNGSIIYQDTFNLTPFNAATAWATVATATPMLDMRNAKLRHRGHSVSFGRNAKLYLNSTDVNSLLANTNPNDLGAKRVITVGAGAQPFTLANVNTYMFEADLPQIVEYDKTYIDDSGTVQLYIAQGYGVLVGARETGEPVGEFLLTRNADNLVSGTKSNPGQFDNLYFDFDLKRNPARGVSTMSFAGAPAIYFPSAVVPFRC